MDSFRMMLKLAI